MILRWGALVAALFPLAAAAPRSCSAFVPGGTSCTPPPANTLNTRTSRPRPSRRLVVAALPCIAAKGYAVVDRKNAVDQTMDEAMDQVMDQVMDATDNSSSEVRSRVPGRELLLLGVASPLLLLAAITTGPQASVAAVTGGRIGGGYTPPNPASSAPRQEQQQQQRYEAPPQEYTPPRAGRDIYGSAGSRVRISYSGKEGSRRGNRVRFDSNVGEAAPTPLTPGSVAIIGCVSAGMMTLQRYNRKRFLEDGGESGGSPGVLPSAGVGGVSSKETAVVTTLQLSAFSDRRGGGGDVLSSLEKLSETADVNSPRGLSALVNDVCLTLLRSERDWMGASGGIKEFPPNGRTGTKGQREKNGSSRSRAKREFNRAVMRERSKWERETVSNTPDRGFSSSTAPGWRRSNDASEGTHAVATLMVVWAGLRSTPPQPEARRGARFWQDGNKRDGADQDIRFSVVNRDSAMALLEWLGDEAAEGRGENIMDVEVLWTPADPDDSLAKDDLDTKWPELRSL